MVKTHNALPYSLGFIYLFLSLNLKLKGPPIIYFIFVDPP